MSSWYRANPAPTTMSANEDAGGRAEAGGEGEDPRADHRPDDHRGQDRATDLARRRPVLGGGDVHVTHGPNLA
ncbi:MAG: hypothetical protein ABWX60_02645, partial [Aeromicrobium sp.]